MPCAETAAWSARPSPVIAGTTTTSSPGRRTRRSAARRFSSGCPSSHMPSRWSRSNTRSATGRPGRPDSRSRSASSSARPRASTTTSSPSRTADRGRDPDREPARAPAGTAPTSTPRGSTTRTSPVAGQRRRARRTRGPGGRPRWARTASRARRRGPGAASATSARRRPGGGAPARAGTRAARPSRADGSPSPRDRLAAHAPRPIRAPHPRRARPAHPRQPEEPVPRPARPDDLYRLAVPFDPPPVARWPHGRVHGQASRASGRDGYRQAVWSAPADGSPSAARQADARRPRSDGTRGSPRTARRSRSSATAGSYVEEEPDRPKEAKEREDSDQVHLLPLDGGEARRLTDLPRGVSEFAWSPDGTDARRPHALARRDANEEERRRGRPPKPKPGEPPLSDYRYIDRLGYQFNGAGLHRRPGQPPLAGRRRDGRGPAARRRPDARGAQPAWSPDGTRIAFAANRRREPRPRASARRSSWSTSRRGEVRRSPAAATRCSSSPAWTPRRRRRSWRPGRPVPAGRLPRPGIWRFAADGSDAGAGRRHRPARRERAQARRRR